MPDNPDKPPGPLAGVTVLDLTTMLAGPYATLLLAGLGARVIKIENPNSPDPARGNSLFLGRDGVSATPEHDDDLSLAILDRGRNKEAVTLNLKHPEAHAIFMDLVRRADVVVENFSPGVTGRLGIDYARCREVNPKIVYTSISGFGPDADPTRNKAVDIVIQAMSGLMMASGAEGEPPVRVGIPIGDQAAPLFATIGTLAAVLRARATGQGQQVDVSLLGTMSALVAAEPFEMERRLGHATRSGNVLARLAPSGVFPTADGHIAISAPKDVFAAGLFRAMGRPELIQDERFSSRAARVRNHAVLHEMVGAWTGAMDAGAAAALLTECGVPNGPVRDPADAVRDPGLLARGETARLEHPVYGAVEDVVAGGLPIRMSDAFTGFDRPAVTLGASNGDVYRGLLGYGQDELERLAREGVI
ncbi:CaiB/BaiF CoA transferase family protein [Massilia arenae]|uniref:CoA transferase n=1 Tax=Massilia arenae TaxID=2603288 RepID=A0A5C7G340_9BURK|nr:CoA transferase [Massilia arenae]TXF99186.1 CoA transferase [Massilia arenae]